ncbi:hypothetical protein ACVWWK_004586 [Bradyrhizobium sp. LB9.1b]
MRALALAALLIGLPVTAFAGGGFDIVVPGRPGVPIIINNIDASYTVIEGTWGLGKNVQVQPTIYGGRYVAERQPADVGHYYPTLGPAARLWAARGRAVREPQIAEAGGELSPELGRAIGAAAGADGRARRSPAGDPRA